MSDYSKYPEYIDTYSQLPLVIDKVSTIDAVTVNRLRDAIINIETELGTLPSGDFDSVKDRLNDLENNISTIVESDITDIQSDIIVVQSDITDVQSDITDVQSDITDILSNISSLESSIALLEADLADIITTINASNSINLQSTAKINGVAIASQTYVTSQGYVDSAGAISAVEGESTLALASGLTVNSSLVFTKALLSNCWESEIAISANDTLNLFMFAHANITITAIKLYYHTAGASSAGTYLFTASANSNNLLNSTNYDLEGISNATLTTMSLTATTSNLNLSIGDKAIFTFTSNNADLTGGSGGYIQVIYTYQ